MSKFFLWTSAICFILFSNPFIFNQSFKLWEGRNFTEPDTSYNVVVVLGGFSSWNSRHEVVSFNQASDRLIEGLKMYHRKQADKILISGGSGLLLKPEEKESLLLLQTLTDLKVKKEDLILETTSRNTFENAKYTCEILKNIYGDQGKFVLITSAFHMRRAKRCFEKYGLRFDYIKTDFYIDDDDYDVSSYLIPSAHVLGEWQILIKEMLGYVIYGLKSYY